MLIRDAIFRQGILWYASWDIRAHPRRGNKPFNISPQFAQRLSNGNTLICECWDIIEVTRELDIVWQFGEWAVESSDEAHLRNALCAWCYEDTGMVLVADTGNNRVLEIDRKSRRVIRMLGGIPTPASAFLNPDNGNLIIASKGEHWVCEMTWDGDVVWEFGVRGEAGSDAIHLRNPWSAHPAKTTWGGKFDGVLIADYGNHRILLVRKSDNRIVKETLSTGPELALQTHNLGATITGQIVGFVLDQDWDARWFLPHNWRIVPTPEGTYLLFDRVNLCEVDPRLFGVQTVHRVPGAFRMLTQYRIPANASVGPIESDAIYRDVPPIPAFAFKDGFTIWIKASAPCNVEMLTAKTKWSYAPSLIFDGWEVYATDTVASNKLWHWRDDEHHAFISVCIHASSCECIVDVWVSF